MDLTQSIVVSLFSLFCTVYPSYCVAVAPVSTAARWYSSICPLLYVYILVTRLSTPQSHCRLVLAFLSLLLFVHYSAYPG